MTGPDSVATAGAFDGCLSVLGGIEVVRTLNERGIDVLATALLRLADQD